MTNQINEWFFIYKNGKWKEENGEKEDKNYMKKRFLVNNGRKSERGGFFSDFIGSQSTLELFNEMNK